MINTTNSHHLTDAFSLLKNAGRMYFLSLGVKGLNFVPILSAAVYHCSNCNALHCCGLLSLPPFGVTGDERFAI